MAMVSTIRDDAPCPTTHLCCLGVIIPLFFCEAGGITEAIDVDALPSREPGPRGSSLMPPWFVLEPSGALIEVLGSSLEGGAERGGEAGIPIALDLAAEVADSDPSAVPAWTNPELEAWGCLEPSSHAAPLPVPAAPCPSVLQTVC
jgi:hypothetical protein